MSTSPRIQCPGSRLRSIAGAVLATLGVLIAVGIGALFITSLTVRRAVRPPSITAPSSETCSGRGYRPHRRTSHASFLLRAGRAPTAPVYRRDRRPKSVWRARGAQPINANREMVALALPATAVARDDSRATVAARGLAVQW